MWAFSISPSKHIRDKTLQSCRCFCLAPITSGSRREQLPGSCPGQRAPATAPTHGRAPRCPPPTAAAALPDLGVSVQQHLLRKPHFDGVCFQPRPLLCGEERRLGATLEGQRCLVRAAAAGGAEPAARAGAAPPVPPRAPRRGVLGSPSAPSLATGPSDLPGQLLNPTLAAQRGTRVWHVAQCPSVTARGRLLRSGVSAHHTAQLGPRRKLGSASSWAAARLYPNQHTQSRAVMGRPHVGSTSPLCWASQNILQTANHSENGPR